MEPRERIARCVMWIASWRWVWLSAVWAVACQNAQEVAIPNSYEVAALVAGMDVLPSDSIRTSHTFTLNLDTSQGQQILPLTGGNGTYVFPEVYSRLVFLGLQVQKQPDEYFCHRSDATAVTTAPTTLLGVQCDYMGPEFFHMAWNYAQVQLHGGGIELHFDAETPSLYGLWTSMRISQDERIEIGLARDGEGGPTVRDIDPGAVIVTLPSHPIAGTTLSLQPTDFALGAEVPVGQASTVYISAEGKKSYAIGTIEIGGFGVDVASRVASVGSLAIDFTIDATLETDAGVADLQGMLMLSATNDPARDLGAFRTQDGTNCLFDRGQTVAIDASGIKCRDAAAAAYYYRPVYSVATTCIESAAAITQGTHACTRTQDERCEGLDQFPRCE